MARRLFDPCLARGEAVDAPALDPDGHRRVERPQVELDAERPRQARERQRAFGADDGRRARVEVKRAAPERLGAPARQPRGLEHDDVVTGPREQGRGREPAHARADDHETRGDVVGSGAPAHATVAANFISSRNVGA